MIFSFDGFEVDEERFELRRGGETVALQPRVLEMLIYLVRNRHRLVRKRELIDGPWQGANVVDSALHQAVYLARSALEVRRTKACLIQTVRGKGFRFIGHVVEVCQASDEDRRGDEGAPVHNAKIVIDAMNAEEALMLR